MLLCALRVCINVEGARSWYFFRISYAVVVGLKRCGKNYYFAKDLKCTHANRIEQAEKKSESRGGRIHRYITDEQMKKTEKKIQNSDEIYRKKFKMVWL